MAEIKAFYSYFENEEKLNLLTDEQAGRLYKSLYAYARTGVKPDLSDDPLLQYAFTDFIIDVDRDREKYEQTCQRRAEAGRKGGQANAKTEQANEANAYSDEAKQANAYSDEAKQANANFAKNEEAKTSKTSETETEAEAEAEYNASALYNKGSAPDFDNESENVLTLFRKICTGFVCPAKLTDHRRRLIYQAQRDKVDFEQLFKRAQASDFLTGRKGGRGGFGFDWLLEQKNRQKVIEGNYDNKPGKRGVFSTSGASFDVSEYEESSMFDD